MANLNDTVRRLNLIQHRTSSAALHRVVNLNESGSPEALLGGGEHFDDAPRSVRAPNEELVEETPMDKMMEMVQQQQLLRPLVRDRR